MSTALLHHPSSPVAPCWFCGQPEVLEIGDIWTDGNFQLDTCCEALLDSVSAGMDEDPAWGRDLLRRLGAEVLTGHRLRRVSDGQGCHPMLDWQLELRPIRFAQARTFIARHHRHCSPPVVIWTTCISTSALDSADTPSGWMERSDDKDSHPACRRCRPLSFRGDRAFFVAPCRMRLLAEH